MMGEAYWKIFQLLLENKLLIRKCPDQFYILFTQVRADRN